MVNAWADAVTTAEITGVELTDQQLLQAQAMVEVFVGRTYDQTSRLRPRDVYWLGRAVAFQAVWAAEQPGLLANLDLTANTQDGVSATLKEDALVLAPMAARAINRLSWRKSRTVHVRSPFVDGGSWLANPLSEQSDVLQPWRPMENPG